MIRSTGENLRRRERRTRNFLPVWFLATEAYALTLLANSRLASTLLRCRRLRLEAL